MLYVFLNSLRSSQNILDYTYKNMIWFLETIASPIVIIYWFKKEFEFYTIAKIYVITGLIASLVSIFLLLNPSINNYVRSSLISYSGVDILIYENIRGYGIAEGLLGPYALIQGIILCISFYKMTSKPIYTITTIPIIISIAINARTGLLAIPIGIVMLIILCKFSFKVILLFLGLIISSFYFVNTNYFIENYIDNAMFIISAFDNLNGNLDTGATETLLYDELFKPSSLFDFFFGTSKFGPNDYVSDNGYFYLLWYGGVSFLLVNLLFIYFLFNRLLKNDHDKYITVIMFMLLFLFNSKWNYFFVPSGLFRLIGLYYVYKIVETSQINTRPKNLIH